MTRKIIVQAVLLSISYNYNKTGANPCDKWLPLNTAQAKCILLQMKGMAFLQEPANFSDNDKIY